MPEPAEIVLTFDNLGEAAEQELGTWQPAPDGAPHPSLVVLPRVLDLLAALELHATFFVEAVNVERHPAAVRSIADGGHELAGHAWRHESWPGRSRAGKQDVLGRSLQALRGIDAHVEGFRPPGGVIDDADRALLPAHGVTWVSPAGSRAGVVGDLVVLPFAWGTIDAFAYAPALAPLRLRAGLAAEPLGPAAFAATAARAVDAALLAPDGDVLTIVLHPYLHADEERWAIVADLLRRLARERDAGRATVGPGRHAAARLRRRPLPASPILDRTTWS